MGALPLPDGNNAAEMIRRLRVIDAEIFGTLYANAGIIGGDVSIEGTLTASDIISSTWDGSDPLDLSSKNTITAGYALDDSEGVAQFATIYADGGELGDLTIAGTLTMGADGVWQTAASGSRWEWDINSWGDTKMAMYTDLSTELTEGWIETLATDVSTFEIAYANMQSPTLGVGANKGYGYVSLGSTYDTAAADFGTASLRAQGEGTTQALTEVDSWTTGAADSNASFLALATGSGDATATLGASATGAGTAITDITAGDQLNFYFASMEFRMNANHFYGNATYGPLMTSALGTVALPGFSFVSDTDTGMYRVGANALGFGTSGTRSFYITNAQNILMNDTNITNVEYIHNNGGYWFTSSTNSGVDWSGGFTRLREGGSDVITGNGSNQVYLGGMVSGAGSGDVRYASGTQIYYLASSKRFKKKIRKEKFNAERLAAIDDWVSSSFKFKDSPDKERHLYSIAEDVEENMGEVYIIRDDDGLVHNIERDAIIALLAENVKDLRQRLAVLEGK